MITKILILASNSKETTFLELPIEIRNLSEVIKRSPYRDRFIIETRLAVCPKDLQAALLEVKPRIVHFCGHGEGEKGLVLENDAGQPHLVSSEALASLFRHFNHQVECVLLNACHTKVQAEELVKHINFVIGMNQPILDLSAIAFAEGFYGALGADQSIAKAYELGCNRIHLELGDNSSQPRQLLPVLTETENEANSDQLVAEHLIPTLLTKDNLTIIEQPEELTTMQPPESDSKGNSISFGDKATVQGDVVAGDQTKTTTYKSDESDQKYSQVELLELLNELKSCFKQATIDEDEKDIATGQIAGAIREVKQSNLETLGEKKDKIGEYLQETKTILDRVKDVGEIGAKAFPIFKKIATIIGLSLL